MKKYAEIYAEIIHNGGEDKITRDYIYRYAKAGYLYKFPKSVFGCGYLLPDCPREKYLIKVY